jgi:predicted nucleotidyltransferase/uncharacterized protein (UPF0332 family)
MGNKDNPSKWNTKNDKESTSVKDYPTLKLKSEHEIAMDFSQRLYQRFDKLIKAVVLFGSSVKKTKVVGSDIDLIIVVDDASVRFDDKFIYWYREELGKIIQSNPYKQDLHINTVRLTTWWNDLIIGDPVIINVIRYGEAILDLGGFFNPLKILLQEGRIKPSNESVYNLLNRVPIHILRSKQAEASAIEGCYWAMVESAQALLMTIRVLPPSPEHIGILLTEHFVNKKLLDAKWVKEYSSLYEFHKKIAHGEMRDIEGKTLDEWQDKSERFFKEVIKIINQIIS